MKFIKRTAWLVVVIFLLVVLGLLEVYDTKPYRRPIEKRAKSLSKALQSDTISQSQKPLTNQESLLEHRRLDDNPLFRRENVDARDGTTTSKVDNVVFLKLHKAASSTVQNIFLRYGFFRNLSFVLPKPPGYYWRNVISLNDTVTKDNILPPPKNRAFNILCSHVLYNSTVFQSLMPSNTKYIGIIRDPHAQFLSTMKYIRPHEVFHRDGNPLEQYLKNPQQYESKNPRLSFTNNRMAVEFGFPSEMFQTRNVSEIHLYIQKIDKEFDLVIVVEKFDESLILMKRLLRWSIKDVIYISQNKNKNNQFEVNWTDEAERNFQSWNSVDLELYKYFKIKIIQRIKEGGENLQEEVTYFRWVLRQIKQFCEDNGSTSTLSFADSKWSKAFNVYRYDCWLLKMGEITFLDFLQIRQYPEIQGSDNVLSVELIRYFESIFLRNSQT